MAAVPKTRTLLLVLLGCAAGSALLYVSFGTLSAFLASDDFGWLGNARVVTWNQWFIVPGRTHFYRPVVEMWFAALTPVCDYNPRCYHAFSIGVHAANTALFCALVTRVGGSVKYGAAAAAIFAALPGYAEAVVWVSASTILLAAFFWLSAAHVSLSAAQRSSVLLWMTAAVLAGLAMFSHESAASLFLVLPVLLVPGRSVDLQRSFGLRALVPFAIVVGAFALSVVVVDRRNYVFTEGHYRAGLHMVRHALDYVAALYVGPHRPGNHAIVVALLIVVMFVGGRLARIAGWWMLVTLVPYVAFTWGNVSRYLYLPAMGFSFLVAAVVFSIAERLARTEQRPRWVHAATTAVVLAFVVRFAVFTRTAIHERADWMEAYRRYSDSLAGITSTGGAIVVPAPTDPRVEPNYVDAVVRWTLREPLADVIVRR